MAPSSRIPHALQEYVTLGQEGSLVLLTNVLGASSNWVLFRFLSAAFASLRDGELSTVADALERGPTAGSKDQDDLMASNGEVSVVLVSFLRDWEFWRTEARRECGLDISGLSRQKRFAFVDGLSSVFTSEFAPTAPARPTAPVSSPSAPSRRTPQQPPLRNLQQRESPATPATGQNGVFTLTSSRLQDVERIVEQAIHYVQPTTSAVDAKTRVLLLIDNPDILLATADPRLGDMTAFSLNAWILSLRRQIHTAVVSLAADMPLASVNATPTPLESNHAALLTSMAHASDSIISLRLLDTGFAADVSGVLRITRKGSSDEDEESGATQQSSLEGKEFLYYLAGDGSAKVFVRGAGTDVG